MNAKALFRKMAASGDIARMSVECHFSRIIPRAISPSYSETEIALWRPLEICSASTYIHKYEFFQNLKQKVIFYYSESSALYILIRKR
jgi:hypothetical protein